MKPTRTFWQSAVKLFMAFTLYSFACVAQTDTIQWREDRQLQWNDFTGEIDPSYNGDALTAATISYETFYDRDSLKFKVLCYFNKSRSWTKHQDDTLLKHEQGHFDITEIFARQLRKELKEIPQDKVSKKILDDIFKKMMDEKRKKQDLYDRQTNSSLNRAEQLRWNGLIKLELQQLAGYRG